LAFLFTGFGLDKSDQLASVLGVFIAIAALAVAVFGLASPAPPAPAPDPSPEPDPAPDGVHNEVTGTVHGNVVQFRDLDLNGPLTFGAASPAPEKPGDD